MNIYLKTGKRNHTIIVQPGREHAVKDFLDANGQPLTFTVEFVDGVARGVPSNLGQYLIDKDVVQSSPIVTDLGMLQRNAAMDERVRTHRILNAIS